MSSAPASDTQRMVCPSEARSVSQYVSYLLTVVCEETLLSPANYSLYSLSRFKCRKCGGAVAGLNNWPSDSSLLFGSEPAALWLKA